MPAWYTNLTALTVAAIPLYLWRVPLLGIPTNIFELLVATLVIIGLLTPSVRQRWREAERALPWSVIILTGLFIIAALLSAIISDVPHVSFGIFKSWIIIPLLLGWIIYANGNIRYSIFDIRYSLIISGVVVSLLSLTEFQWGQRLSGIYDVPNSLALYLAPLIVVAVAQRKKTFIVSAFIMFLALLATQSITGLLSVLVALFLFFFISRKTFPHFEMWKGFQTVIIISILLVAIIMAGWYLTSTGRILYLVQPLTSGQPNSISVRLQLWDISWKLIQDHPVLGISLGQFEPVYQQKLHERFLSYQSPATSHEHKAQPLHEFVYRDPHNWILSFWLNTGILGLLSFAAINILAMKQFNSTTLALGCLLFFGLVDTIYWKNDLSALHWILLALSLRTIMGKELRTDSVE